MQLRRPYTAGVHGARRDAGAAAEADDIFMRALLCEGAVSALERYAHAFHGVQLTARISSPEEFHARNVRRPRGSFGDASGMIEGRDNRSPKATKGQRKRKVNDKAATSDDTRPRRKRPRREDFTRDTFPREFRRVSGTRPPLSPVESSPRLVSLWHGTHRCVPPFLRSHCYTECSVPIVTMAGHSWHCCLYCYYYRYCYRLRPAGELRRGEPSCFVECRIRGKLHTLWPASSPAYFFPLCPSCLLLSLYLCLSLRLACAQDFTPFPASKPRTIGISFGRGTTVRLRTITFWSGAKKERQIARSHRGDV